MTRLSPLGTAASLLLLLLLLSSVVGDVEANAAQPTTDPLIVGPEAKTPSANAATPSSASPLLTTMKIKSLLSDPAALDDYAAGRTGCCCEPNFDSAGGQPCTAFPMVSEYLGSKRPIMWPYMTVSEAATWCPFTPVEPADGADMLAEAAAAAAAAASAAPAATAAGSETSASPETSAGSEAASGSEAGSETSAGSEAAAFIELEEEPVPDAGSEAAGSEAAGSEAAAAEAGAEAAAGSEAAASPETGAEAETIVSTPAPSMEETTTTAAEPTPNIPACRFFPGLVMGANANCIESCKLLKSAVETRQDRLNRVAAIRALDDVLDMSPVKPSSPATSSGAAASPAAGAESGGEASASPAALRLRKVHVDVKDRSSSGVVVDDDDNLLR